MSSAQPWNRTHRTILFIAWLGWTFDIMDAAIFNLSKQRMVTELLGGVENYKLRGAETEASLLTVFLVAWSIGGVLFGWLSDRFGRVKVLALTVLIYSLGTGLTAFCHSWEQLVLVRFVTGLGIGGEWSAGAAWVAESVPDSTRAKAASWLQSAAAIGPLFAAIANTAFAAFNWRVLFLVGCAPALMTLALRRFSVPSEKPTETLQVPPDSDSIAKHWKTALAALLLGTAGIATAQNVTFWLPNLVTKLSPEISGVALQLRQSNATMTLHIGTLAGVFMVPWLCSRFGRKWTLSSCLVLSPIIVALVALTASSYQMLLLLAPLMSVLAIGIGAAFALYFPELFPRSLRATGAGLAYNGGRILAACFPLMTAALIKNSQGDIAKSVAQTGFVVAIGGLALFFLPETKHSTLMN